MVLVVHGINHTIAYFKQIEHVNYTLNGVQFTVYSNFFTIFWKSFRQRSSSIWADVLRNEGTSN